MALPDRFTVEPIWRGIPAVIIGGGESFSTDQAHQIALCKLEGRCKVIAVNDAIYPAWWADWLHAGDSKWWWWHIQRVHTFPGIKTTLAEDVPRPWVTGYLKNTGRSGFDPDPSCCRTGANSVYQAMCLAIHAGVSKITLVGVDMVGDHFFGKHPDKIQANYGRQMQPEFPHLKPTLAERGIPVFNASPISKLEDYPLVDLKKSLAVKGK